MLAKKDAEVLASAPPDALNDDLDEVRQVESSPGVNRIGPEARTLSPQSSSRPFSPPLLLASATDQLNGSGSAALPATAEPTFSASPGAPRDAEEPEAPTTHEIAATGPSAALEALKCDSDASDGAMPPPPAVISSPQSAAGSDGFETLNYMYDRRLFKHVLRSVQVNSRRFQTVLLRFAAVVRKKLAAQDGPGHVSGPLAGAGERVVRMGTREKEAKGQGGGRRLSVCDLLTSDLRNFAPPKVGLGEGKDAARQATQRMREGPREALTGVRLVRYDAASRIQLCWLRRARTREMARMARATDEPYTVDTLLALLEQVPRPASRPKAVPPVSCTCLLPNSLSRV